MIGGRATGQGYVADNTRQKFTGYEADAETGLNFAQARYQSSVQGRFISVDPLGESANVEDPQTFNRYAYALNDPSNKTDRTGMMTGAEQGWSSVQDGFWGAAAPTNQTHFGGFEVMGERLFAHDTSILKRLKELKTEKPGLDGNYDEVIVTNSYAFHNRQEYEAYFRRQFQIQRMMTGLNFLAG